MINRIIYNAENIPIVHPFKKRKFYPTSKEQIVKLRSNIILKSFYIEDIIEEESINSNHINFIPVNLSKRIFEVTNEMLFGSLKEYGSLCFFHCSVCENGPKGIRDEHYTNTGELTAQGDPIYDDESFRNLETPLVYEGNPVRILNNGDLHVFRLPEFLIKSGTELGY